MRDLSLTPEILSRWLQHAGTLSSGAVTDVHVELEVETPISTLIFLTVTYSAEVKSDLPRSLVVKSPLSLPTSIDKDSEVQFYRKLAPFVGTPPLVRCLAAIEDTLVLEDIRATHDHPPWPLPPSRTHSELAVDALARIHAQWWESPTLGHTVGKPNTPESLTNMVQGIAAQICHRLRLCCAIEQCAEYY